MLNMYGQYDPRTLSGIDWLPVKSKQKKQPATASSDDVSDHIAILTDGFMHVKCFSTAEANAYLQQGFTLSEFN